MAKDWHLIHGVYPYAQLPPLRFDVAVVRALQQELDADLINVEGGPVWSAEGFQWNASQLVIIQHRPSNRFWTHDWSDTPQEVRRLCDMPGWSGSWLGSTWHAGRIIDGVPEAKRAFVWPGWFLPFYPETIVQLPSTYSDPRLLWAGTIKGFAGRRALEFMRGYQDMEIHEGRLDITRDVKRQVWTEYAAQFGACLCLPGGAPWNNREFDCWGAGIPTLLVPHGARQHGNPDCWIPVEVECDWRGDPINPETAAEKIVETWLSVRGDSARLRAVAARALKYYQANCTPAIIAKQLGNALKLKAL